MCKGKSGMAIDQSEGQEALQQVQYQRAEEAQSLLAAIVMSSDDAIVSKTLEGIITSWNDSAVKLFGYSAEEAIGQHITFIIPPHLHKEEEEIIARLKQGKRIEHFETVRVTKDGSYIEVSLSISPVKDQQGKIIGAAKVARDISQRRTLERKLQEADARYRQLFDSNLIGVFVSDFAGTFLDANDAFLNLIGYTREELLTETVQRDTLTLPEFRFLSQNAVKALQEVGSSDTYEKEYLHKSGRRIPVLIAVKRIGQTETCIGFVVDITERKRVEEQQRFLAEVSKVLSSTLDYKETLTNIARLVVPQLADWFSVDLVDAEGRFELAEIEHQDPEKVQWVQAYREKFPIDPDAPTGLPAIVRTGKSELYPEITDDMVVAAARSEEELAIARLIGLRAAMSVPLVARGKIIGVASFVSALPGKTYDEQDLALAEEVGRRAGMALDNARLYQEIRQAYEQKDEFVSMASHELKTPVTSLKGFTFVLQRRLSKSGDEQSLHYLSRMDAQLNKLSKLIRELLDISRIQTGKLELQQAPFDLDTFVKETVENVQAATTTHHLLVEGKAQVYVFGDKDRLEQVLINLLTNAIKYSPQANNVVVYVARDEKCAIVRVQDFGIGIDEIYQQKIFERFYQVTDPEEKTYPGLGIGLYISKEIIERHNGRLEVHSRKGEGATFTIILPLLVDAPPENAQAGV